MMVNDPSSGTHSRDQWGRPSAVVGVYEATNANATSEHSIPLDWKHLPRLQQSNRRGRTRGWSIDCPTNPNKWHMFDGAHELLTLQAEQVALLLPLL